jgi:hypothetical protein
MKNVLEACRELRVYRLASDRSSGEAPAYLQLGYPKRKR